MQRGESRSLRIPRKRSVPGRKPAGVPEGHTQVVPEGPGPEVESARQPEWKVAYSWAEAGRVKSGLPADLVVRAGRVAPVLPAELVVQVEQAEPVQWVEPDRLLIEVTQTGRQLDSCRSVHPALKPFHPGSF